MREADRDTLGELVREREKTRRLTALLGHLYHNGFHAGCGDCAEIRDVLGLTGGES